MISLFAGMQKNPRSDLGSERGRVFLCTEEGNINLAFSRVSIAHHPCISTCSGGVEVHPVSNLIESYLT